MKISILYNDESISNEISQESLHFEIKNNFIKNENDRLMLKAHITDIFTKIHYAIDKLVIKN